MTKNQYRAAIEALGLSQAKTAEFLGVSERQGRRWALGEAPIPPTVAMLLQLMLKHKLSPEDVNSHV
jgi:transcriptional regulator with XRE-family HTH domain